MARARNDIQGSPSALSPEELAAIKDEERAHEAALVKELDAFAERERDLDELTAIISSSEPSPTKDEDGNWDESQRKYLAPDKTMGGKQLPVAASTFQPRTISVPGSVQPAGARETWGDLELQLNDRERRILVDVLGAQRPEDLTFVTAAQVSFSNQNWW
eukprot:COSAG02_NODE_11947_length_1626_cov_5.971185_2_plen_160_part_00